MSIIQFFEKYFMIFEHQINCSSRKMICPNIKSADEYENEHLVGNLIEIFLFESKWKEDTKNPYKYMQSMKSKKIDINNHDI